MVELKISREDSTAVDLHLDAAQRHAALHAVAARCEGVGESVLLGCGGDFERVAAAGDAVLDASGNELLVGDGSGLAVYGDGSEEREKIL
jgi:hypothetical protein